MESHGFLWYLAVFSARSLGLACVTWLALRVFRVQTASLKHAAWTMVTAMMLVQVVASPVLPSIPLRVLAPLPEAGPTVNTSFALPPAPVHVPDSHNRRLAVTWRQGITAIYAMVVLGLFGQLAFGYVFARRLVRTSEAVDGPRVRESEAISVPMTVGQIAPVILLPKGWREWDPAKLQAVLGHEEAHVRRADWAIGVMARINCCVFWFHPLAWWLKRELALLAEYACDDSALLQMGDRRQYARALLEIARSMKSAGGRLFVNAVPMAKETNVEKRMEQILDEKRKLSPAFGRRGWVALSVCSLPVGYFASAVQLAPAQTRAVVTVAEPAAKELPVQIIAQARPAAPKQVPAQTAPAPAPAQAPAPAATPYKKWLDEDVRWIISDEERTAFKRLQTDDEHEAFIEQFWLRRDPTPGTTENEMKEENYRRIAFANDHFSVGIPGWQTDRGMIYIRYGPPLTIDTHGATASTFPYETWRYRYIEGVSNPEFEFVDPTMTGRYHLTKDPTEKTRQ